MARGLNRRKAQALLTYSVLIAVVIAALLGMRVYFIRAMQDKIRQSADVFGQGEQYEKGLTIKTNSDAAGIEIEPVTPIAASIYAKITGIVSALEEEISELREQVSYFNKTLQGIEDKALTISSFSESRIKKAEKKEKKEAEYRLQAEEYREKGQFEKAEEYTQKADKLQKEAQDLRQEARELSNIANKGMPELKAYLDELTQRADAKAAEIADYKSNYPDCF